MTIVFIATEARCTNGTANCVTCTDNSTCQRCADGHHVGGDGMCAGKTFIKRKNTTFITWVRGWSAQDVPSISLGLSVSHSVSLWPRQEFSINMTTNNSHNMPQTEDFLADLWGTVIKC